MRLTSTIVASAVLILLGATPARAQSTDGYHAFQVFPLVVDNDSFKTRLTFSNESSANLRLRAFYLPGEGTSQLTELDCGTFMLAAWETKGIASVRDLCPLPVGTQFGTLYTRVDNAAEVPGPYSYGAFSRVQNPLGMGFSVEGFPAHTFTGAATVVSGLRRLAATAGNPAYQSNCFVGTLHREVASSPAAVNEVAYQLYAADGALIGSGSIPVQPGRLVRILDIFAHAGVPPGDVDDASIEFVPETSPGVLSFCTVQDNTHFSADFRIAKQAWGVSDLNSGVGPGVLFAQDDHVLRRSVTQFDVALTDGSGGMQSRSFIIPAGSSSNAHFIQFRRPDYISCNVVAPLSFMPLNNLEVRLMQGAQVLAGGDGITWFGPIYTGDKTGRETNGRYVLEVERAETGAGDSDTPYVIRCRSGSGHSTPVLLRTGGPNQF